MAFYAQAYPGQGRWYFDVGTGHGGAWTRDPGLAIAHRPRAPFVDWTGVRRNPARDWWDVDANSRQGKWMSGRIPVDASVGWPMTRAQMEQMAAQGHPHTRAEELAEQQTIRQVTAARAAVKAREEAAARAIPTPRSALDPNRFVMWRGSQTGRGFFGDMTGSSPLLLVGLGIGVYLLWKR